MTKLKTIKRRPDIKRSFLLAILLTSTSFTFVTYYRDLYILVCIYRTAAGQFADHFGTDTIVYLVGLSAMLTFDLDLGLLISEQSVAIFTGWINSPDDLSRFCKTVHYAVDSAFRWYMLRTDLAPEFIIYLLYREGSIGMRSHEKHDFLTLHCFIYSHKAHQPYNVKMIIDFIL